MLRSGSRSTQSRLVTWLMVVAVMLAIAATTAYAASEVPIAAPRSLASDRFDVQDPGFEYGLAYWILTRPDIGGVSSVGSESGADHPVYIDPAKTVAPYSGSKMLRLGNPALSAGTQRTGTYGVSQRFVPKAGQMRLAFRVLSWETRGKDHLLIDLKYGDQNAKGQSSLGSLSQPLTIAFPDGTSKTFSSLPISLDIKAATGALFDSGWKPFVVSGIPSKAGRPVELAYSLSCDDTSQPSWVYFDEYNGAPTVIAHSYETNEDEALSVSVEDGVLLGAADPQNDDLTAAVATGPSHGALELAPNGSFTYTPASDYSGTDTFTFTASDGGALSEPGQVSITVRPVNDPPVAEGQTVRTNENQRVDIALAATDADGDPLSYDIGSPPAKGTLVGTLPNITYVPNAFVSGSDSFTFVVSDGRVTDDAEVAIVIDPSTYIPVGADGSLSTNEDDPLQLNLAPADAAGNLLSYDFLSPTLAGGTIRDMGEFVVFYDPKPNFNGDDTVTYTVKKGTDASEPRTILVHVNPVNDAPVADAQSVTTAEDTALAIELTGSDVEGSSLNFEVGTAPLHGTLSGTAPTLIYTPDADFNGSDSLTFLVNDGELDSSVAVVDIDVTSVNDVPVPKAQAVTAYVGVPIEITLGATHGDPDNPAFSIVAPPLHGTFQGADAVWRYEAASGYKGPDEFTFRATDASGAYADAKVTINVLPSTPVAHIDVLDIAPIADLDYDLTLHEGDYLELLGSGSYCPDPLDPVISYEWTISGGGQPSVTATEPDVYYALPNDGTYAISLKVTTGNGATATSIESTTVGNLAPGTDALSIEALPGKTSQLIGRFIDSGWHDTHSASWMVDGTTIPGNVAEDHYAQMGTGRVTGTLPALAVGASASGQLTVTDADGGSSSASFNVTAITPDPGRLEEGDSNSLVKLYGDATPPVVNSGSVRLAYIQSAGDVDFYEVKGWDGSALPYNTQVLVTLKDVPADYDLAVFEQVPAALFGSMPAGRMPAGRMPAGRMPAGRMPAGRMPAGRMPAGRMPAGRMPVMLAPAGRMPAGRMPAGRMPAGRMPAGRMPAGRMPAGRMWDQYPAPELAAYPLYEMGFLAPDNYEPLGTGDIAFSELGLDALVPAGTDVIAYSAGRGNCSEAVLATVDYTEARIFVAVVGANGAFDSTQPYALQVETSLPYSLRELTGTYEHLPVVTQNPTDEPSVVQPAPAVKRTLIVTAPERMTAYYGLEGWNSVKASLMMFASRPEIGGEVLALPSTIYNAWDADPYSVEAANAVSDQIRTIIAAHTTADTEYVVLVGNDRVIPQRRLKDQTVISNELYYAENSFAALDSPLAASLYGGYDLTDDFYVDDIPSYWQAGEFYVPDRPVGRLVEKPEEINAVIDAYVAHSGAMRSTGIVSGYDFFADGASAVASTMDAAGVTHTADLISSTWSAANLKAALLSPTHDLSSINAHFAHYAALSSGGFNSGDYNDLLLSTQVGAAPGTLAGRLIFSMGCHSGLNVPDGDTVQIQSDLDIDPSLDFAQAMASQGASFIGPSGFGLGDTAGIGGTERLVGLFTEQVCSRAGMTVGEAVVAAKRAYLTGLAQMTTYDVKSTADWTLYGLPMYAVTTPQQVTPTSGGSGSGNFQGMGIDPAPFDPVSLAISLTDNGVTLPYAATLTPVREAAGDFFFAGTPLGTLNVDGRPLQPSVPVSLSAEGGRVHGVMLNSATFTDHKSFDPAIGTFTTGWIDPPAESPVKLDGFWPASPVSYNFFESGGAADNNLVFLPGQFKATSATGPVAGTERIYSQIGAEVLRSDASYDGDNAPPTIGSVSLFTENGPDLFARIEMAQPLEDVRVIQVLAVYEAGGVMTGTRFVPESGHAADAAHTVQVNLPTGAGPQDVTLIVQVADAAGNVAVRTGKGATLHKLWIEAGPDQVYLPGQLVNLGSYVLNFADVPKPVSWRMDFGDGESLTGSIPDDAGTGSNGEVCVSTSHTYFGTNGYTYTFTVTDGYGTTAVDTSYMAVMPAPVTQWWVSPGGSDTADGSEATPWRTIQHALDAAPPDATINVAPGPYSENLRIWKNNQVLTTIPGGIVMVRGMGQASVLEVEYGTTGVEVRGFQIMNGQSLAGGGIFCDRTSESTFVNCMVTGNIAIPGGSGGAGLYGWDADVTLLGCTFNSNTTQSKGGAISLLKTGITGSCTITSCTIVANIATEGGAIYSANTPLAISATTFQGNNATGGTSTGGGIFVEGTSPSTAVGIYGCSFLNNTATRGGALYAGPFSSPQIMRTRFVGNTGNAGAGIYATQNVQSRINSCVFWNNSGSAYGSAMYSQGATWTTTFCNNTVYGNNGATSYSGAVYDTGASMAIFNCILDGNKSAGLDDDLGGTAFAAYSYVGDGSMGTANGNIDGIAQADPGLANPTAGDFRLRSGAIVTHMGTNSWGGRPAAEFDFFGFSWLNAGVWDMGAYLATPS